MLCPASSSSRSDHRFCHRKALEGTKGGEGQAAWEEGGAIYIFGELELKMALKAKDGWIKHGLYINMNTE